jgi:hypothetical protein
LKGLLFVEVERSDVGKGGLYRGSDEAIAKEDANCLTHAGGEAVENAFTSSSR